MKKHKVTITDSYDDVFELLFSKNEYPNLRSLIATSYPEDFGECKGRGLCGTCHVKVVSGSLDETIDSKEKETLKHLYNVDANSRLACQILANENINTMIFKII